MKYKILCFFLILGPWVRSQDTLIIFDRPGVADSPYLVPEKIYLVETGIGFTDQTRINDLWYPSIMLRKRLGKTNELRVATSTFPQSFQLLNDVTDIHPLVGSAGIKQKLFSEKKIWPETSFILNSYFNFSSGKRLRLAEFVWECQLLFQSNINEWFSINYNTGYIHQVNRNLHYINQSTCFSFQLTKNLCTFVESFNYFSIGKNKNEFSYDVGLTYLIRHTIQFDLSYIANHNFGSHYGTVLTGISFGL